MATPLIKPIAVQGGTFFTFSSAASDITKTFTDDDARFVFSKFVCLDLPDVETPINQSNQMVWEGAGMAASGATGDLTTDQNVNISQSLQNYALNLEDMILNSKNSLVQDYDDDLFATTSERVLWKWLIELGAIRFEAAPFPSESNVSERFKEEQETNLTGQNYSKVVQYIGDLDIINTVQRGGHSYTEIFIHVPTNHGNTPLVLFKTHSDANYQNDITWDNASQEDINDRDGATHPAGLSLTAYYDDDTTNSYLAGPTFGLVTNQSVVVNSKTVLKSDMAGVALDFDDSNYVPVTSDPNISTISELNADASTGDFDFNAVLIYYDTYSASNPEVRARNLYGILIIDDYTNTVDGGSLKQFAKFKPNPVTKLNGNSYGLKLNIKFDTSVDNVGVVTVINDYNTFSMELFSDALIRMQEVSDMFLNQKLNNIDIDKRMDSVEKYFFTQDTIDVLIKKVNSLEQDLNNSNMALESATTLLDLIAQNSDKINTIVSGNIPLELIYNTDAITFGDGVVIDKSVPNKIKIINKNQSYSSFPPIATTADYLSYAINNGVNDATDIEYEEKNNIITLGKFSNYFKNKTPNAVLANDLVINVSDLKVAWTTGQTLRISFDNTIDFNGHRLFLFTDAGNKFDDGVYGKTIAVIDSVDMASTKPVIDIICSNENDYSFFIDIIK